MLSGASLRLQNPNEVFVRALNKMNFSLGLSGKTASFHTTPGKKQRAKAETSLLALANHVLGREEGIYHVKPRSSVYINVLRTFCVQINDHIPKDLVCFNKHVFFL